jgi:hypothetical protein
MMCGDVLICHVLTTYYVCKLKGQRDQKPLTKSSQKERKQSPMKTKNTATKLFVALSLALVLSAGFAMSRGTAHAMENAPATAQHVSIAKTTSVSSVPNSCFHTLIPDVNIWGNHTYLEYVYIQRTVAIYFQDLSLGNGDYYVQWWVTQDNIHFQTSGPQYWSGSSLPIWTPITGLQVGPVNSNINNPHAYAPGVFNCQGLWYPPMQVTR